ncbi:hypothetical protein JHK82_024232 [Glycine max]|nr:hypothetical protein JHK85_024803 [Glycine max]KAG5012060.1 hypothetical protein JHK86_024321 [Glycine max]KAG5133044.1 hypothetical protein JHK82_024232 [Glycine max]
MILVSQYAIGTDKAMKRFVVRNIVEQVAVKDVQDACIPPTPGQLVKEPTFIHVVVGLLDSTSKDIPLSIVYDSMRLCNLLEVMINQSALQSLE